MPSSMGQGNMDQGKQLLPLSQSARISRSMPGAQNKAQYYQQVARQYVPPVIPAKPVVLPVSVLDERLTQLSDYASAATAAGNHLSIDMQLPGGRVRLDNAPALRRQSEQRLLLGLAGTLVVLGVVVFTLLT